MWLDAEEEGVKAAESLGMAGVLVQDMSTALNQLQMHTGVEVPILLTPAHSMRASLCEPHQGLQRRAHVKTIYCVIFLSIPTNFSYDIGPSVGGVW